MTGGNKVQVFTNPAQRVLFFAHEAARKSGVGVVSTEHLLLGLVKEHEGVAAQILKHFGVTASRLQQEFQHKSDMPAPSAPARIVLSEHAKQILEHAANEARELNPRFGLHYVCTEYILLAIINNSTSREIKAAQLLSSFEVDFDRMREFIMSSLAEGHQRTNSE